MTSSASTRVLVLLFAALSARAGIILSDPFSGTGGDFVDRGFYVTTFPGSNLGTVTLAYNATVTGTYTTSLTARLGAYDGAIIGATETAIETINDLSGAEVLVTYDFGGVAVAPGSLITFTQVVVSGPGGVYYDLGTVFPGPDGLTETDGTVAPLDTFRRNGVGVMITQADSLVPEPSTLLLVSASLAGLMAISKRRA